MPPSPSVVGPQMQRTGQLVDCLQGGAVTLSVMYLGHDLLLTIGPVESAMSTYKVHTMNIHHHLTSFTTISMSDVQTSGIVE